MTSFEENNGVENDSNDISINNSSNHTSIDNETSETFKPSDTATILDLLNSITTDSLQLQIKINLHVSWRRIFNVYLNAFHISP